MPDFACPHCRRPIAIPEPEVPYVSPVRRLLPWALPPLAGLLGIALGGVLVGVVLRAPGRTVPGAATPGAGAPGAPGAVVSEAELLEQIRAHPFWAKKPTREGVEAMVGKILAAKRNVTFGINDEGEMGSLSDGSTNWYRDGGRLFYVDLDQFDAHPNKRMILELLKWKLDKQHFRKE